MDSLNETSGQAEAPRPGEKVKLANHIYTIKNIGEDGMIHCEEDPNISVNIGNIVNSTSQQTEEVLWVLKEGTTYKRRLRFY